MTPSARLATTCSNPSDGLLRRLRRSAVVVGLMLLGGCASTQTSDSAIPAAGRPLWSQCGASVTAWCHRQGQGDPTLDRDCEATTAREYAALPDEAARRQYLTAHTCSL